MSTLESQYKEFIKLNPRADLSFEEWFEQFKKKS